MKTKKILVIIGIFVLAIFGFNIVRGILFNFVGTSTTTMYRDNDGKSGINLPSSSSYGFGAATPELGFNSAGGSSGRLAQNSAADIAMPIEPPVGGNISNIPQSDRKIVKNGSLSIVVKNVEETIKKVTDSAIDTGGYVSTTNLNNYGRTNSLSGYIRVRIPVDKVEGFISSVKGYAAKVQSENISSQDVTSQYIDLQARIKNLEASEAQYQEFMKRATNVTEVLNVQRELTSIRGQIEQLKGQMQYLEGSAEMSDITINVAVDEAELPIEQTDKWKPEYVFKVAWNQVIDVAKALSYLAIYIIVFAVLWIPLGLVAWVGYKFLRKKLLKQ